MRLPLSAYFNSNHGAEWRFPSGRPERGVRSGATPRAGRAQLTPMPKGNSAPAALAARAIERFQQRKAVVGVLGLGYVGLPLALRFAEVGLRAIGFDIDAAKVEKLKAGRSYINYIPDRMIRAAKRLEPTTNFARARECDALIICVPTPLDRHR